MLVGVVPENVRVKRSKMMRGLSQKLPFYESQLGSTRTSLFERKEEGYLILHLNYC
jgi:threonylcarbamoyladenosine tRNA methylthiotransferase MtaB